MVSVDDFIRITQDEVSLFRDWWLLKHSDNPAHFPLEMDEGDWFDQFLHFVSGGMVDEARAELAARAEERKGP